MTTLRDWFNSPTSFLYDLNGNLTAKIYPNNNTRVDQTYDANDRVIGITHSHSGTPFLDLTYTRDAEGLLRVMTDSVAGPRTYQNDTLDRLTGDTGGLPDSRTWGYNGAYEITTTTTLSNSTQVTTTRGYNAANELLSLVETRNTPPYSRTVNFDYNGVGDRVSQIDSVNGTTVYTYNQESQLTGYTYGSVSASYTYNGDGLRMSKHVGASTQQMAWDTGGPLPMLLSDGVKKYLYGPDGLPMEEFGPADPGPYFYHADQLGSTRALTDPGGNVADTTDYDPYGVPVSSTGSAANPFGYAGEYSDAESSLIYLRARSYDPATQQFLTRDPLLAATEQAYAYAGDGPLNATDPGGLASNLNSSKSNTYRVEGDDPRQPWPHRPVRYAAGGQLPGVDFPADTSFAWNGVGVGNDPTDPAYLSGDPLKGLNVCMLHAG